MKPKLIIFLLLISLAGRLTAQQGNLPPVVLGTDTIDGIRLEDSLFQMLPDPARRSFEEIRKLSSKTGFFNPSAAHAEEYPKHKNWWFRYSFRNDSESPMKISVGITGDTVHLYTFDSRQPGKVKTFISGSDVAWANKSGFLDADLVPVIVAPQSTLEVYAQVSFRSKGLPENFTIGYFGTDKMIETQFLKKEAEQMPLNSFSSIFFAGFFLLAALFNLVLFLVTREKEYGWLTLFLFFLFIQMNPYFTIVTARENKILADRISESGLLYTVFFFQFIRYFFKTDLRFKWWDRVLYLTNIAFAVAVLAAVTWNGVTWIELTRSLLFLGGFVIYAFTLLNIFRKRDRETRLFLGAMLPFILSFVFFLITGLTYILFQLSGNTSLDRIFDWVGDWGNHIYHISVSWAVLFFAYIIFRRYDLQKKEVARQDLEKEILAREQEHERNALIARQKIELEEQVVVRTAELKSSLDELKTTQRQLIHAEKMASLGELTSGIAHEIQNPLNFINNFSEINTELIEELQLELENGNLQTVMGLSADIKNNENKILYHGKRADGIVKGMLQHSRGSQGRKEVTDIQHLCEEYLRLSLNGIRMRHRDFQVKIETSFDPLAGKLYIVPQEAGQAIFNIFNNAFDAVRNKMAEQTLKAPGRRQKNTIAEPVLAGFRSTYEEKANPVQSIYVPEVDVCVKRLAEHIEIRIRDNGTGIPEKIRDKIFQPFFTTKPTGEGTGLGLSLAYDIITRGHGGELEVLSEVGIYSEFIIRLPV